MKQENITFIEDAEGALIFQYEGRKYLYAGRKDGIMYGISTIRKEWKELLEDAGNRAYEKVGQRAVNMGLDFIHFDLGVINIDAVAKVTDLMETYDDFEGLGIMTISKTDCRSPDGITIGLIDGMIAMARVLRKANLSAAEVQEALKDFTTDEDVKWLMEHSVQNWEFGEEVDKDWQLGDPLTPVVVAEVPTEAKYKVHYLLKTWPKGWDTEEMDQEFATLEDFHAWLAQKAEWCMAEDNGFKARIFVRYGDEGFPYQAGSLKWESEDFADKPMGWKPTVDNLKLNDGVWASL